jgi:hypothetical protein
MNTATKVYKADDHGVVRMELPTGKPGRTIEVTVSWEESANEREPDELPGEPRNGSEDWSDLFGILKDSPIERAPQGEYEKRDAFE